MNDQSAKQPDAAPYAIPDNQNVFSMDGIGYSYARPALTLPVGKTLEEALKPEFWRNVLYKFKADKNIGLPAQAGAIIDVRTQDHAFYAELYVLGVSETGLHVKVIKKVDLQGASEKTPGVFDIRWNVGKRGFDVVRKTDNQIVADAKSLPTRELAQKWVADTVASAGRAA